jgi:molybdopterin-binding protein
MKLSARNQIPRKIAKVEKGQTTSHVHIDVGKRGIITASITNEAVDNLRPKKGDAATVVIKASHLMVARQSVQFSPLVE